MRPWEKPNDWIGRMNTHVYASLLTFCPSTLTYLRRAFLAGQEFETWIPTRCSCVNHSSGFDQKKLIFLLLEFTGILYVWIPSDKIEKKIYQQHIKLISIFQIILMFPCSISIVFVPSKGSLCFSQIKDQNYFYNCLK